MKDKPNNKEPDIHRIWEKAGNKIHSQQQLNKENMETLINNTSTEFSSGMKRLIKADAIFKVIMSVGFIMIAAFNLANIMVMLTSLVCIIIVLVTLKQERLLIEGIKEIQEYSGGVRNIIERDLQYCRRNILRFPVVLSVSIFLFYVLGNLIYHNVKYNTIQPVKDMQDAIVLSSFLLLSMVFSFVAYYPFFRKRVSHLQHILNDIDNPELVGEHIENHKARKRKVTIITSVSIVIGILVLLALLLIFL